MYAVEKLSSYISRGVYTVSGPFHPFGGAVDIIVVQQQDGSYKSSPWYVRFGKFQGVLKTKEKLVTICVNGEEAKFHMYLDHKGEAYFLKECDFDEPGELEISSPSSGDENDEIRKLRFEKVQSCNYDGRERDQFVTLENGNGKIVTRARSKRAMLLGLFGKKSMKGNDTSTSVERVSSLERAEIAADLLETKWSTNLSSNQPRAYNTIEKKEIDLSVVENEFNGCEVKDPPEEGLDNFRTSILTKEDFDNSNSYLSGNGNVEESIGSHDEKLGDSIEDILVTEVHLNEETITQNLTLGTHEEAIEVYTLEIGQIDDRSTMDAVLENNDKEKEVNFIRYTETPETLIISTESDENTHEMTSFTESKMVIEDNMRRKIEDLELSRTKITSPFQDSPAQSLSNGSTAVSPEKSCSHDSEIMHQESETMELSQEEESRIKLVYRLHENELIIAEDESSFQISENLEDMQFPFSDLRSNSVAAEADVSLFTSIKSDEEEHELENKSNEECFETNSEVLANQATPIDIPIIMTQLGENEQLLTKSVPIIRSQIHDLDRSNPLHPLSCSLEYNAEKLGSDSTCASLDAASAIDFENNQGHNVSPFDSAVELSQCKPPSEPQDMMSINQATKKLNGSSDDIVPNDGSWRLWPFSLKKSKTISTACSVPGSTTPENLVTSPMRSQSMMSHDDIMKAKFAKKKVRSLTPTSEELASLNLNEGRNVITFSFSTSMLGQQQVDARIYLWKWNTRIVISDVDGTITKSDVLGQFMPLVGKDWSQTGVAHLFSAIKENGYQFLFLSARAISQAHLTRRFLLNLIQDGKALPDGPVVISPDGLFPSLYREVIRRAPHEFKISCLEDIRALFPVECNPFYAGFGNRETDEFSYLKVGIPKGKIFIVNPKGEVVVNRRVDSGSYNSIHTLVDDMFPPATAEPEEFNRWNFWKLPPLDIDI